MIYIERTINIEDNSAYIEEPVVLYKGDSNIEVQFIINNNPFKYKAGLDLTYGQLVIKRPTTDPIFSEVAKLSSNKVLFIITGDMIDELIELGNYDFQIRLLNADMSSRATLPPVSAGILIKEPICEEGVNTSPVNYSRAVISREIVDTFDEEGNYNKTEWSSGDIITDSKLNKIEDALYTINNNSGDYATKDEIPTAVSQLENDKNYQTLANVTAKITTASMKKADKEHTHDEYITDISHLATKEEIPTKTSELTNDSGYATEQYVNDAIDNIEIPRPNLSNYATKQYVDDAVANVDVDLTGYATETYVNDAISNMPKEIPTVSGDRTRMSQLQSDFATKGFYYLSGVSVLCVDPITGTSMGNIYLEDGLYYAMTNTARVSLYSYTTHESYDFDEYVDSHRPQLSGISCVIFPSNFATEQYVQDAIGNIEIPEPDLSNYATKDELPPIRVIGSDNPDEPYILTGNEFTEEDYENCNYYTVLFKHAVIRYTNVDDDGNTVSTGEKTFGYSGDELAVMSGWINDGVRQFDYQSVYGSYDYFEVRDDGTIIRPSDSQDWFVYSSELDNYATKDELNTMLGDIESLLGEI